MRKTIYRSAITGKLVTRKFALENPDTTVKEVLSTNISEIIKILESYKIDSEKLSEIKQKLKL